MAVFNPLERLLGPRTAKILVAHAEQEAAQIERDERQSAIARLQSIEAERDRTLTDLAKTAEAARRDVDDAETELRERRQTWQEAEGRRLGESMRFNSLVDRQKAVLRELLPIALGSFLAELDDRLQELLAIRLDDEVAPIVGSRVFTEGERAERAAYFARRAQTRRDLLQLIRATRREAQELIYAANADEGIAALRQKLADMEANLATLGAA